MTSVPCPNCGTESAIGKKFCPECGAALPLACPVCGSRATGTRKFCDECGTSLQTGLSASQPSARVQAGSTPSPPPFAPDRPHVPVASVTPSTPQEERRLVTALFCDMVGFTPLAEQLDPEEVRDLQTEYFAAMSEQIERYGGTVEKFAGDAILALFGAPVAHDDDAERAVLCALGMQAAIEPVASRARERWRVDPGIRVGVNTGEVVSGTWNASGRHDVAVTGDALNTAARIQAAADGGEVLVGTETMRLTRRRIQYGERRDLVLKGKSGTVPVYPAAGLRERFGERWETSEKATPLIGRDREMVGLLDAWVRAQAGEGQLVTLIGDAGVGKSRLIAEMIDKVAPNSAARVVRARCLSYGQQISLWLIADLLRSLFGISEQDGLGEAELKLNTALPGLLIRCDADAHAEARDVLGEVLGLPPGHSMVAQAGAQIRRQALIRSLKLVLGVLSERTPTVLVMEDMHWVDGASQDVVKEILGDVPGLRMLVLVAQRPGWNAPWSEWGWTERTNLRPLRDAEAALLAGTVLGGMPLSPELEAYVGERAGGNPFFVEELLRALEESGGLEQRNGGMTVVPGVAERVPISLTEMLLARLDRLEGDVRSVAQVASVIGRNFAVRLVAQVMERESTTLELPLSALQQAEIAFPRRGSDVEYVFKHVTMREVAYNTLVQKRRHQLHLETARAITALYPADEYVELLAYHYARTADDTEAAIWLERAGDRASTMYAMDTAIDQYGEARRRWELVGGDPTALARLDEKLGEVLNTVGRNDEALPLLERAVDTYREARDLEAAGRATAVLGKIYGQRGTSQEGLIRVEPMVELLRWNGPSPALASLHLTLAVLFQFLGRYEEMLVAAERADEIAKAIGHNPFLARAMERRGTAFVFLGRFDEARSALEEALPLLERVGDLDRLRQALCNLGEANLMMGKLEEARRYNERFLEISERVGNPSLVAFALQNLGQILLTLGRWHEAREHLERAAEVLSTLTSPGAWDLYTPATLGQVLLAQGDWEAAEAQLEHALGMAKKTEDRQALEWIHISLGELGILRGDAEAAITRLEPLTGRAGGFLIFIETTLAWALLDYGDVARAEEIVSRTVESARKQQQVLALVDALRVLGMVLTEQGKTERARDILDEGLALARSLPYPYAEARILVELDRQEEALLIFRRLGGMKDVERTEQVPGGARASSDMWPTSSFT